MRLVDHRDEWSAMFAAEAAALRRVLGDDKPVEHIGSTAIPGMPAKPIIDMMAAVPSMDAARDAAPQLAALGYHEVPHRTDAVLVVKTTGGRDTHNVQLTTITSELWRERLAFRDALRADTSLFDEYRALKERLLRESGGVGYVAAGKREFVRRVLASAGVTLRDDLHASA